MKYRIVTLTAVCSALCLGYTPRVEANGSGRPIRADLPCPYGGAGPVNSTLWSPIAATSPFNPGAPTANAAALVAGVNITTDSGSGGGLDITGATQYDWYTNPIPAASTCSNPSSPVPADPIEQVIDYNLAAGGSLGLAAGDTEVQFNYDTSLDSTKGVASFTMGGVTYTSTGPLLPTSTDNSFLFSSTGALLGALTLDANGNTVLTTGVVPAGWTESSSGGGGGGGVSAPEIDPSSTIAALTLLVGGLAVLRAGRRARVPVR
jgi:hypothetical protein